MSPLPVGFTDLKRSGPPTTRNGTEWEVPLSGEPPREWIQSVPQGALFQPGRLIFRSSSENVAHWVDYIDKWIVRANANYRRWLGQTQREAEERRRAQDAEAERLRQLNERFKNL